MKKKKNNAKLDDYVDYSNTGRKKTEILLERFVTDRNPNNPKAVGISCAGETKIPCRRVRLFFFVRNERSARKSKNEGVLRSVAPPNRFFFSIFERPIVDKYGCYHKISSARTRRRIHRHL